MSIRVLIVDDSCVARTIFAEELSRVDGIEVVGAAPDAFSARDMIVKLSPDVITLDIEMPRMDGITFLRKLMRYYPIPVVVVSSLSAKGGEKALAALEAGCVDVICKPHAKCRLAELSVLLVEKIQAAVEVDVAEARKGVFESAAEDEERVRIGGDGVSLIAVGASTGGPRAINSILGQIGSSAPGIVIAQHMPEEFTKSFARRLDKNCGLEVKEAEDGEEICSGKVLIAPGNRHLIVGKKRGGFRAEVKEGPLVCRHRPSIDVLFKSVARHVGKSAIGVLLTGMGYDGADGLLSLREAGAATIGQDEQSSVVYGMAKEAVRKNAVQHSVALSRIARKIADLVDEKHKERSRNIV